MHMCTHTHTHTHTHTQKAKAKPLAAAKQSHPYPVTSRYTSLNRDWKWYHVLSILIPIHLMSQDGEKNKKTVTFLFTVDCLVQYESSVRLSNKSWFGRHGQLEFASQVSIDVTARMV